MNYLNQCDDFKLLSFQCDLIKSKILKRIWSKSKLKCMIQIKDLDSKNPNLNPPALQTQPSKLHHHKFLWTLSILGNFFENKISVAYPYPGKDASSFLFSFVITPKLCVYIKDVSCNFQATTCVATYFGLEKKKRLAYDPNVMDRFANLALENAKGRACAQCHF